ncbi:uncharacterized protein LOC144242560 [Crocuta crocuta]
MLPGAGRGTDSREEREAAGASPGFAALGGPEGVVKGPGAPGDWRTSRQKQPAGREYVKVRADLSQRKLSVFTITDQCGWILPDNLKLSSCKTAAVLYSERINIFTKMGTKADLIHMLPVYHNLQM